MEKVERAIVKMVKYVLFYNLIYIIFNYLYYGYICDYYTIKAVLVRVLLSSPFGFHLWYLTAFLQVLLCLYIGIKCRKVKFMFYIAPFLYAVGVVLIVLPGIPNLLLGRNFLFLGIPCVLAGMYIRQHEQKIMLCFFSRRWILLTGGFFLVYFEYLLRRWASVEYGDFGLLTLPFSCTLFLFFLSFDKAIFPQWLVSIGKNYSLDIYIYHVMVSALLLKVECVEQLISIKGIIVFLLSWGLSAVLYNGKKYVSKLCVRR